MVRGPVSVGVDINSCGDGTGANATYNTAHDLIPGNGSHASSPSIQNFKVGQDGYNAYVVYRGIQRFTLEAPEGREFLVISATVTPFIRKFTLDEFSMAEYESDDEVIVVDAKNGLGARSLVQSYGDMLDSVDPMIGSVSQGDLPFNSAITLDVGMLNDAVYGFSGRLVRIGYRSKKDVDKVAPTSGKWSVYFMGANASIDFYYLVSPEVETAGTENPTPTTAELRGHVMDSDGDASVYFEWIEAIFQEEQWIFGGDWTGSHTTPVQTKGNDDTYSAVISGLTPNQGYAFRTVGYNAAGYFYSSPPAIFVTAEGEAPPASNFFHISAIRHTYRPGSYRAELTFGDVTATPEVVMLEIALPKKKEPAPVVTPEDKTPKIEEPPVVVTVPEKTAPELIQAMIEQTKVQFDLNSKINLFPSSDDVTLRQPPLRAIKVDTSPIKAGEKAEEVFQKHGYSSKDIQDMIKKGMKPAEILELLRKGK